MFTDQIDTQKGIRHMAGKEAIYIKIVNSFLKQEGAKVEELNAYFAAEDFDRLTIEFHGLKSSAASLGSTALPTLAHELEMAGKAKNNEIIREKYAAFIEQYRDTCGALAAVIAAMQ